MRRAALPWRAAVLAALLLATPAILAQQVKEKAADPAASPAPAQPPTDDEPKLAMGPAIACLSINGFEDYEPLPGTALSSDEKLLVYYRPLHYRVDYDGVNHRVHLVQDGQIRPRGKKTVLQSKLKMVDEDWKGRQPPGPLFMRNTVALKGLKPGEYEFDIILHDMLAPGEPVARQSLPFKVVPAGARNERGEVMP